MILNTAQTLLFVAESNSDSVAVVDTDSDTVVDAVRDDRARRTLAKARYVQGQQSEQPGALARRKDAVRDQRRNELAGGDRAELCAGGSSRAASPALIPTGYYPNAVAVERGRPRLHIANGMSNTGPNPDACRDTCPSRPDPQPRAAPRISTRGS